MRSPVRRKADHAKLEEQCRAFNDLCKIGQKVSVRKDDGTEVETVTQSDAWVLSGHTAVIQLQGIRGCYDLGRVTPLLNGVLT